MTRNPFLPATMFLVFLVATPAALLLLRRGLPREGFPQTLRSPTNWTEEALSQDSSWCPFATCVDSPLCAPCRKRYLILIATGRSASTSMLDMMNALPGVRLSGENSNLIYGVQQMLKWPLKDQTNFMTRPPGTAWGHNPIRQSDLACGVQTAMEMFNPPPPETQEDALLLESDIQKTIVGFKTIRFDQDWKKLDDAVTFVRDHFPCSRIVVNLNSDVSSQAESMKALGWTKDNKSAIEKDLAERNRRLESLVQKFGEGQAFLMDTAVFSSDPTDRGVARVNDLVQWLGFKNCKFQQLLHANKNHSLQAATQHVHLGPDCHYGGDWNSV